MTMVMIKVFCIKNGIKVIVILFFVWKFCMTIV